MGEHTVSKSEEADGSLPRIGDLQRIIVETSVHGVWVLDREGRTLYANRRMAEMLGFEPDDLRPRTFFERTDSDQVPAAIAALPKQSVPEREVQELRLRHRDGHIVEARVTTSPLYDDWRAIVGALLMVEDLTELRAAQLRAEQATRRFEGMAQAMPDCFWSARVQPSGQLAVEYLSPGCYRIWGLAPDAPRERPELWQERILPEDRAHTERVFEAALASGRPQIAVYRVRRGDGALRWVEDHIVPDAGGGNGTRRLMGLARDITDRRQLEANVTERQREHSLSLLAGGIAHDFNNILMAILGQTSVVRRQLEADARGQAELRVVEQAAKRAADLCRQLLAYAGRSRFEVEPTDLSELVNDMRGLIKAVVPTGVEFDFELARALPLVDADTTQMRQVIMNVVANAGEAMKESGGTLQVRTGTATIDVPTEPPEGVRHAMSAGPYVTLTVDDRGCGMTEDVVERIFDPFFTTKPGGHGLGLAAVLGIVRGHRGSVGVRTTPGGGTTVTIYLPASKQARAERRAPSQPPATEEKVESVRVLVVEDEPTVRNIVRRMLELSGHRVVLAEDGVEGVERFQSSPESFDLAVLDLTMPRMNGIETMRALRQIRPDLPVLMTSGHAEEDSVQKVIRESELAAFIQKPYRYGELMGKIQKLMARAGKAGRDASS
jgi:PAS domain S-box-containing protein